MSKKRGNKKAKNGFTPENVSAWGKAFKEWNWLIQLLILLTVAVLCKQPLFLLLQRIDLLSILEKWFSSS